jgi:hypothetical protein
MCVDRHSVNSANPANSDSDKNHLYQNRTPPVTLTNTFVSVTCFKLLIYSILFVWYMFYISILNESYDKELLQNRLAQCCSP